MTINRWGVVLAIAVATIAGAGYFFFSTPGVESGWEVSEGRRLYGENCAMCHGANLEGQPDWMKRKADGRLPSPPHDESGHTWHHSDKQLFTIVKFGLQAIAPDYESDMPAYGQVLADPEIAAILTYIKSTWPERPRGYQEARSKTDP